MTSNNRTKRAPLLWITSALALAVGASMARPQPATADPNTPAANRIGQLTQQGGRYRDALFNQVVQVGTNANVIAPNPVWDNVQVHMGAWSGDGMGGANRTGLLATLENINATPNNFGFWDEGVPTVANGNHAPNNFAGYVAMTDDAWYLRMGLPLGANYPITNQTVNFNNTNQTVTAQNRVQSWEADQAWGQYSARYVELAVKFWMLTGRPVKVWCYTVNAARARIFYLYEYPVLQALEKLGAVLVYFPRNANANWQQPADWDVGTTSNPPPWAG